MLLLFPVIIVGEHSCSGCAEKKNSCAVTLSSEEEIMPAGRPLKFETVERMNEELSNLLEPTGAYAHLYENGRLQLDSGFTQDQIVGVLNIVGWI